MMWFELTWRDWRSLLATSFFYHAILPWRARLFEAKAIIPTHALGEVDYEIGPQANPALMQKNGKTEYLP